MKKLGDQLKELANYITVKEKRNSKVTVTDVAWHIDHSLRVINGIIKALEQSEPDQYKSKFNLWRSVFLTLNYLPRGRGKAPKRVLPDEVITKKDLEKRLGYAATNLELLQKLPENAHFPHPVFGQLNRKRSINFLQIHTEHHLKIIRDILKP